MKQRILRSLKHPLLGALIAGIFTAYCAPKQSTKPVSSSSAPADASEEDGTNKCGVSEEAANLFKEVENHDVKACDLKVTAIRVQQKVYEGTGFKTPYFDFDASDEAAKVRCEVTSMDNSGCKDTFELGAFGEVPLKCTGNIKISCRACVTKSIDSCTCGKTAISQVFKFDGTSYKGDALQQFNPSGSGSLKLTAGSDAGASDGTKFSFYNYSASEDGKSLKISDFDKDASKVKQDISNPNANINDFIAANLQVETMTTRLAMSIQNAAQKFLTSMKASSCEKNSQSKGLLVSAQNMINTDASVLGSDQLAYYEAIRRDLLAANGSGGGLKLTTDSSSCDAPVDQGVGSGGENETPEEEVPSDDSSAGLGSGAGSGSGSGSGSSGGSSSGSGSGSGSSAGSSSSGGSTTSTGAGTQTATDTGTGENHNYTENEKPLNPEEDSGGGIGPWIGGIAIAVGAGAAIYMVYAGIQMSQGNETSLKTFFKKNFDRKASAKKVENLKTAITEFMKPDIYDADGAKTENETRLLTAVKGELDPKTGDAEKAKTHVFIDPAPSETFDQRKKDALDAIPAKTVIFEGADGEVKQQVKDRPEEKLKDDFLPDNKKPTLVQAGDSNFDKKSADFLTAFDANKNADYLRHSMPDDVTFDDFKAKAARINLPDGDKNAKALKSLQSKTKGTDWKKPALRGGLAAAALLGIGGIILASSGSSSSTSTDKNTSASASDEAGASGSSSGLKLTGSTSNANACKPKMMSFLLLLNSFTDYYKQINKLLVEIESTKQRWISSHSQAAK